MRMRDGVEIDGGFVPSMHEWYGSDWRYQGLIDARVALGADCCTRLTRTVVEHC